MDSPEVTKSTTTPASTTAASPLVQESPFSNYVSNLSPIGPVKSSRISQGYADLSSPPLVFTSPHMVPQREASLLRRLQCPPTSSSQTAKVVGKSFADIPPDLEKCDSYFGRRFIINSQKDGDHASCIQELRDSPSGCVDEYLSEAVDAECADCLDSTSLIREPSADQLESSQRGLVNLQENKLESETDKEVPNFATEPTDTGHDRSNSQLQLNLVSNEVQSDNSSIKDLPANDIYHEQVGGGFDNPECDVIQINPEASQLHRGMSRRCLQFGQGIGEGSGHAMNASSSSSNVISSALPFSAGIESSNLSDSSFAPPTRKTQMINLSRVLASRRPPNQNAKTILSISKPSGIGLHLNSILNASPMGCTTSESINSQSVDNEGCSAKPPSLVDKFHGTVEDRMIENQAAPVSVSSTTDSFLTTHSLEPNTTPQEKRPLESEQNESSQKKRRKLSPDGDGCKRCNCKKSKCLKLYCDCFAAGNYCSEACSCQGCFNKPEYKDTVLETRQLIESRNPLAFAPKVVHHASRPPAVIGADLDETTPSSARHKRGCNCKKSMCLKKYCECYQIGFVVFINTPPQTEVLRIAEVCTASRSKSCAWNEGYMDSEWRPLSLANVGCSSGCRCEGCKNVYGTKEDYSIAEEITSSTTSKDLVDETADDKLQMVVYSDDRVRQDTQSPAPFTPQLQFSGAPKARPFSTRYLQSPLSDFSTFQPDPKRSKESTNDKPAEKSVYSPINPMPNLGEKTSEVLMQDDDTPEILKEACSPIRSVKATSPNKKRVSPPHGLVKTIRGFGSLSSGGLKSGRKFVLKSVPSFPPLTPCLESKANNKNKEQEK